MESRSTLGDDSIEQAGQDVLAILRAWYRSDKEPAKRRQLAACAKQLQEALTAMRTFTRGSPEYLRASGLADRALNDACNAMHFNASLTPIFGAAAAHLRKLKDVR